MLSCGISPADNELSKSAPSFPLGVWYEGGVGNFRNNLIPDDPSRAAAMYKRDFADMKAHGINAAVVPNTQPDHHKTLLDAAQMNGIKLIVELDKEGGELGAMIRGGIPVSRETLKETFDAKLAPIRNHPALWRVQLLDEPAPDAYERYRQVMDALRSYAPEIKPFCCLAGYGSVNEFMKTTRSDILAFDFYPISVNTPIGDRQPMAAFNAAVTSTAQAALNFRTPVWAVLQTHAITGIHRFPTPEEIRCMTYLSLAAGCRGVWWFLYQTEYFDAGKTRVMSGLVDSDFKGDARWKEVGNLAREIAVLAPILNRVKLADKDLAVSSNEAVHALKDNLGNVYVFAVNMDIARHKIVTIRLRKAHNGFTAPSVINVVNHKTFHPSAEGNDWMWSEMLRPGAGALYRVESD